MYVHVLLYANVNEQPLPGEVLSPETAAVLVARGEMLEELGMEATTKRQVRCSPVGSRSIRFLYRSVPIGYLRLFVGF